MSIWSEASKTVDLRAFLRAGTADMHAAAELRWFPDDGFTSLDHYTSLLKVILAAHRELGAPAVDLIGTAGEILAENSIRQALARDTGLADHAPNVIGPACPSCAWGVLYVLNGSALGASFILDKGHAQPDWPVSYLQASATYVRSGRLRLFLDRMNSVSIDMDAALRGAVETFSMFTRDATVPGDVVVRV